MSLPPTRRLSPGDHIVCVSKSIPGHLPLVPDLSGVFFLQYFPRSCYFHFYVFFWRSNVQGVVNFHIQKDRCMAHFWKVCFFFHKRHLFFEILICNFAKKFSPRAGKPFFHGKLNFPFIFIFQIENLYLLFHIVFVFCHFVHCQFRCFFRQHIYSITIHSAFIWVSM